jgi:hypothetical protein
MTVSNNSYSADICKYSEELKEECERAEHTQIKKNFAQATWTYIKDKHYNKEIFLEKTLLSPRTHKHVYQLTSHP